MAADDTTRRARDEPVRLTRIYTRGGDAGETSLGDGSRIAKSDPLVAAIGAVDELNAAIGLALAAAPPEAMRPPLVRIQNELFDVGADLCLPLDAAGLRVTQAQVDALEGLCDRFNEELAPLKSFVLPGGGEAATRLHLARAICRRAERDVLLAGETRDLAPLVAIYLNRLSDALFILARAASGEDEALWHPGESRE